MKRILIFLLCIMIINTAMPAFAGEMYAEQANTAEWIEWENPDFSKRGGTALDASFLLDAPAGKHGFASANGEDIYFEDGTPARFWGINLIRQAVFPDFVQAEQIVNRVSQSGYNLVRLHQYDAYTDMDSLYGGNGPERINERQLNKMHYLISEMKKKGIYLYLDLLVLRDLEKATGSTHGKPGPAIFFDKELIDAQKEQATDILTTVNPYTGVSLAADPMLAFIEIVNENGIFDINANAMSQYYIDEMHTMFCDWLLKKYADTASLSEAWGSDLTEGEKLEDKTVTFFSDGSAVLSTLAESMCSAKREDIYEFLYDITENYYVTMRDHLRELGVKSMITGVGMGGGFVTNKFPATVRITKEHMDFADMHTYQSHPTGGWSMGDGTRSEKNSLLFIPEMFKHVTAHRPYNMPFVLSEWQETNINQYRAEGIPMMAGYACFQNYIPIQFCLNNGYVFEEENAYNEDCFSTYDDPIHTVLAPLGAAIYLRHEVDEAETDAFNRTNKAELIAENFDSVFNDYDDGFRGEKRGIIFDDLADYNETAAQGATFPMGKINEQMTYYYRRPEHSGRNVFSIDSDYTNMVVGFEPGTTYEFGDSVIEYDNDYALVGITSVADEPLATSKRMLINAVGRAESTDYEYKIEEWNFWITNGGKGPMLAEPVEASMTLKTTDDITVYALDSHGRRIAEVPVEDTEGGKKIGLNGKKYRVLSYEVIRNGARDTVNAWYNQADRRVEVYGTVNDGGKISINITSGNSDVPIYTADVTCEAFGSFSKIFDVDIILDSGLHIVEVKKNNEVICKDEFEVTNLKEITVNAVSNFNAGTSELTVSGTVYRGINPVAGVRVTAAIVSDDADVENVTADELKLCAYDVIIGTTDEMGRFLLSKEVFNTPNGNYKVQVLASPDELVGNIMVQADALSFDYSSVEPYLEFRKDNMKCAAYRIDTESGNGIVGVAQNPLDDGGVLVMAAYRNGVLADALIEDEPDENGRLVLEYIPDTAYENYEIKLMYFDSMGTMIPLTDFYLISK